MNPDPRSPSSAVTVPADLALPLDHTLFSCAELRADLSRGEVELDYVLSGGSSAQLRFTERITLPVPDQPLSQPRREAAQAVLRLLHAVAGVSYFKVAAPATIDLGQARFTAGELAYIRAVYQHGMREFAYQNDLPAVLQTQFRTGDTDIVEAFDTSWYSADSPPLVACGGGKDSIVSMEAMIRSGRRPVCFAVNPNSIIEDVVGISGLPLLKVSRKLDRQLFDLNRKGVYNGHVPVTAVNSLIAVACAILNDVGPVVMSNESSASSPNLYWHGEPVNHQWSKSAEAELALQDALQSRLGVPALYFSLLRHLNEMQIARLFCSISAYDDVMTSCNNAYTIDRPSSDRWCGDCPKCRFVFLALAPHAGLERLVKIFGANLLQDEAQLPGYRALLGIGSHKPFECVGEIDESLAAVIALDEQPQWHEAVVVRQLLSDIGQQGGELPGWSQVLGKQADSYAPDSFTSSLRLLSDGAASQST
jgi:hypothetical protein